MTPYDQRIHELLEHGLSQADARRIALAEVREKRLTSHSNKRLGMSLIRLIISIFKGFK